MPENPKESYDGYFNCSAACWSLFTEVAGYEFGNPAQVWEVHQLTVDSYAVQHAGGPHPDKSITIHLSGLHLALEKSVSPPQVAPLLKRLADANPDWPHFPAPQTAGMLTIFDIAMADSAPDHCRIVRQWAESLWAVWSDAHSSIADLVSSHL